MNKRHTALPLIAVAAAVVGIAAAPVPASVARIDPAAQIKVRHEGMKRIGGAMKELGKQARSGSPDAKAVATQAAAVKRLAVAQLDWFPRGSGPESGQKTHAKADAWTDPVNFRLAQQKFVTEATKLDAVAARGDMAALPAQFQAVGGTCKGCHEKYKEKDED